MRFVRYMTVAATLAFCAAMLPGSVAQARKAVPTESGSGAPPFCVLIGGARGNPLPEICRFFDYASCLQAAADLRGNCVANIDYRGPPPDTSGATWGRGR